MDKLGIQDLTTKFERDFYKKNQMEFENWFVDIARSVYGTDFQPIRAYGRHGDHKCDGYLESSQTVFQCYAPLELKERELINKIDRDFNGALKHWDGEIKEWILVLKNDQGLSPNAYKHIRDMKKRYNSINIDVWSKNELLDLVLKLDETKLTKLFGPIVSYDTFKTLALKDLAPVIDAIEKSEVTIELADIIEPSPDKLDKNEISVAARGMLKNGRQKISLVEDLLMKFDSPDKSEKIAESIRTKYIEFKKRDLTSEQIFHDLQAFVGFDHKNNTPTRQAAIWTVLAYFFDKCDIFEDPSTAEIANDSTD